MDTPPSIGLDQSMTWVDHVMDIDSSLEAIETTPRNFDYFSHGLCHLWLETPFDDSVLGLLRQEEPNPRASPSIHSSNPAPISLPCLAPSTSNSYQEGPHTSPFPLDQCLKSTESPRFSPESMLRDTSSADSNTSSPYDISFANLDFSSEIMFLDAFSADSSSGSIRDASSLAFDFSCSPAHPSSPPTLAETYQSPHLESVSKSPRSSATLAPGKSPNRPCDLRRQRKKIEKPEICPECKKGHAYKRCLMRHIKSRHKDLAKTLGIPMDKFKCKYRSCPTFARKDHLTRHMKTIHGGK